MKTTVAIVSNTVTWNVVLQTIPEVGLKYISFTQCCVYEKVSLKLR